LFDGLLVHINIVKKTVNTVIGKNFAVKNINGGVNSRCATDLAI